MGEKLNLFLAGKDTFEIWPGIAHIMAKSHEAHDLFILSLPAHLIVKSLAVRGCRINTVAVAGSKCRRDFAAGVKLRTTKTTIMISNNQNENGTLFIQAKLYVHIDINS